MEDRHQPKPCPVCGKMFGPLHQDSPNRILRSKARYMFTLRRYCSASCAGYGQRHDPGRKAKTRTAASKTARRLKPPRPCERCGETRRSQVHHRDRDFMNNALDNLERLCQWCHGQEHAIEIRARAARGWEIRRERYGPTGVS